MRFNTLQKNSIAKACGIIVAGRCQNVKTCKCSGLSHKLFAITQARSNECYWAVLSLAKEAGNTVLLMVMMFPCKTFTNQCGVFVRVQVWLCACRAVSLWCTAVASRGKSASSLHLPGRPRSVLDPEPLGLLLAFSCLPPALDTVPLYCFLADSFLQSSWCCDSVGSALCHPIAKQSMRTRLFLHVYAAASTLDGFSYHNIHCRFSRSVHRNAVR